MKNKFLNKIVVAVIALVFCCCLIPSFVKADDEDLVTSNQQSLIMTATDLAKLYENPTGSFQLGADIDLTGTDWKPLDFSGTLDGNGYAILNANVTQVGDATATSYDGAMASYDTHFAGFFGTLKGATISNLKILGINVDINNEGPCFVAGIAGYMEGSHIINCQMEGKVKLTTKSHCFGIGGMAGFGNGSIESSSADMTLVCIDKDVEQKDEQFMGGAFASGYIDVKDTTIHIQGFDSDHGYVHNGGLAGMYFTYPEGTEHQGYFLNNKVSGFIKFQEDNVNGQSLCATFIGEIVDRGFDSDDSFHEGIQDGDNFKSEEIFEYDNDLLPCYCGENAYVDTVVESTESTNGYTEHKCSMCNYYYRDTYKVIINNPELVIETEPVDVVEPKPSGKKGSIILAIICVVIIAGVVVIFIVASKEKGGKSTKKTSSKKEKKKRADDY